MNEKGQLIEAAFFRLEQMDKRSVEAPLPVLIDTQKEKDAR